MADQLVWLLIFAAAAWLAFWIVERVALPSPLGWLARAVIAVAALAALAHRFLPHAL